MKNDNSKNKIIALLVVIIIILVGLVVLFATGTISFKSNDVDTNKPNDNVTDNNEPNNSEGNNNTENNDVENNITDKIEEENDNYLEFVVDNENKSDSCQNINRKNYYSYDKSYAIIIKNISINDKNYTFKYEEDIKFVDNIINSTVKVYLNNNVAFESKSVKGVLVDVCNYGNYIVYNIGWEGAPYYRIINTSGEEVMSFVGHKVNYSNGILSVEELDTNDIEDINDNELIKYQLNMNSDTLQKENLTTEKYVCDPNGPGYDC